MTTPPVTFGFGPAPATTSPLYVITEAFHRMGLIAEDEAPTSPQINRGLSTLNDMMNGFEAEGIQYVHSTLALGDTVNIPDQLIRSLIWMLADDLAAEYGKVLNDKQNLFVANARNALQAFFFRVPRAEGDEGIINRRSYGYWPIGTLTTTSSA